MDLPLLLYDLLRNPDSPVCLIRCCSNAAGAADGTDSGSGESEATEDFESPGGRDWESGGHGMWRRVPWEMN